MVERFAERCLRLNRKSLSHRQIGGQGSVNRFDHLVGKGVFASVTDPAVFMQVGVGERGRSLEWPGEIDFCADALWFEAHPADAPQQPQRSAGHRT